MPGAREKAMCLGKAVTFWMYSEDGGWQVIFSKVSPPHQYMPPTVPRHAFATHPPSRARGELLSP